MKCSSIMPSHWLTVDSIAITMFMATIENKKLTWIFLGPSGSLPQPHGTHYHWASYPTTENLANYFPQWTLGFQRLSSKCMAWVIIHFLTHVLLIKNRELPIRASHQADLISFQSTTKNLDGFVSVRSFITCKSMIRLDLLKSYKWLPDWSPLL